MIRKIMIVLILLAMPVAASCSDNKDWYPFLQNKGWYPFEGQGGSSTSTGSSTGTSDSFVKPMTQSPTTPTDSFTSTSYQNTFKQ